MTKGIMILIIVVAIMSLSVECKIFSCKERRAQGTGKQTRKTRIPIGRAHCSWPPRFNKVRSRDLIDSQHLSCINEQIQLSPLQPCLADMVLEIRAISIIELNPLS